MVWLLASFRAKILAFAVVITTDPRPARKCETSTDHDPKRFWGSLIWYIYRVSIKSPLPLALLFLFNIQISFGISLFFHGIKYFWHIFLYFHIILLSWHTIILNLHKNDIVILWIQFWVCTDRLMLVYNIIIECEFEFNGSFAFQNHSTFNLNSWTRF